MNKFYLKIQLLLLAILIGNNQATADTNKTEKYHSLEVSVTVKELPIEVTDKIKKDLLIFQATSEPKITENRIENLHDRASKEIIINLQSLGYYHAKIIRSSLQEIRPRHWLASYEVDHGPPTIISNIDIKLSGEITNNQVLVEKLTKLSQKFLHQNKQLNHEAYEKTKEFLLNELHEHGFLSAQFINSTIEVNLGTFTATVIFTIDSKQQYYLGKVTFESTVYNHDFLRKFIPFKEHDLYSTEQLMQFKNNLLNSDLFSKVRIDTPSLEHIKNDIIPINVRIYEKLANRYLGSIGFATDDTGIRGALGYTRRSLSHAGHQINLNALGSKIHKEANINYNFIGKDPLIDKYSFGVTAQREQIKERFNKNAEFYIQKSKKYTNRQQFWTLSFLTETFKELPASELKHAKLLIPSLRFIWSHPKTKILTTHHNNDDLTDQQNDNQDRQIVYGNKLDLITKLAARSICSTTNMLQLVVNEKWIQPVISDLNLIFKASIGTTIIRDINKLPTSLRFFAGGDYSVRGFAYKSLGPSATDTVGNTNAIGGKHLITSSFELEKPIYKQVNFLAFIDLGNALNTFNNFNLNKLAIGTGIGLSYKTPVGSICAYLAQPIQQGGNTPQKRLRLHLTFNADL